MKNVTEIETTGKFTKETYKIDHESQYIYIAVPVIVALWEKHAVADVDDDVLFERRVLDQAQSLLFERQQPMKKRRVVVHELKGSWVKYNKNINCHFQFFKWKFLMLFCRNSVYRTRIYCT